MWANEYKAPWYNETDNFYQNDGVSKIDYVHSLGASYDFKNDLILEAAFGQAQGYVDQYFAKASYKFDVAGTRFPPVISSMARATRPITTPSMIFMTAPRGYRRSPLAIRSVRWIYAWRDLGQSRWSPGLFQLTYDATVWIFQRSPGYLVGQPF
jgi:hypothetical protein